MLNELEEFKAYTTPVKYEVSRKGDTAFLGRFTFESLLSFEGISKRILSTIPDEILERQNHMGTCRYRITDAFRL